MTRTCIGDFTMPLTPILSRCQNFSCMEQGNCSRSSGFGLSEYLLALGTIQCGRQFSTAACRSRPGSNTRTSVGLLHCMAAPPRTLRVAGLTTLRGGANRSADRRNHQGHYHEQRQHHPSRTIGGSPFVVRHHTISTLRPHESTVNRLPSSRNVFPIISWPVPP